MKIKSKLIINLCLGIIVSSLIFVKFDSVLVSQASQEILKPGDELRINIVEIGEFSEIIKPYQLVFSKEEPLKRFYAKMKGISPELAYNPGVNMDYNMGVVIGLGEVYKEGYKINIDKAVYTGRTVEIYTETIEPTDKDKEKKTRSPYIIAAIYNNRQIRDNIRLIRFIDTNSEEMIKSIPVRQIGMYPFYEIPERVRVKTVERGDHCNLGIEAYGAFGEHNSFEHTYKILKEDGVYQTRPPELNFLGNIVIIMTMGEKQDGGYSIDVNGAYTNTYMLGDSIYVMVKKIKPTEKTIRYYDITRPYMVGSIQVGPGYWNVKKVIFIDEITGKTLVERKIKHQKY